MFALSDLALPIVQAPMAGGPSTPALAVAVSEAGGLGLLAAGYKSAAAVRDDIRSVRAATDRAFGVNLFVPAPAPAAPPPLDGYLSEIEPEARRLGVAVGDPRHDDDDWSAKLEVVIAERVSVVSFTFGCPEAATLTALHEAGIAAWVTVTSVEEALEAAGAGADALVVQGVEAGGHRGGFRDDDDSAAGIGLIALLRLVAHAVARPLVATGGIADGAAVAAVLCAGASAAQVGTALMLADEAATTPAQRELLAEPGPTALTRAFTGRTARGLVNRFMREHDATAPSAYPHIHHATSGLRAAARERGDADAFNLWAGQAHELAQARPAGEIVAEMAAEARRCVEDVRRRLG